MTTIRILSTMVSPTPSPLTFQEVVQRMAKGLDFEPDFETLSVMTKRQIERMHININERIRLNNGELEIQQLPQHCRVVRGLDVYPADTVSVSDDYLTFNAVVKGQVTTITCPIGHYLTPYDILV